MTSYRTSELQDMILGYLRDGGIDIRPLVSKDDLNKVATKPVVFLQFIENRWSHPRTFNAVFNVYFVAKTLAGTADDSLLTVMDKVRDLLASGQVEYEGFVEKSSPIVMENEAFAETKSMVFVYVSRFSVKVSIKKGG